VSTPAQQGNHDPTGVKEEPMVSGLLGKGSVFGEVAIGRVPDDGQPTFLTLDTELVSASSMRRELKQGQNGHSCDDLELMHVTGGGVAGAAGLCPKLAAFAFDLKLVLPAFLTAAGDAKDEGEVGFFDSVSQKAAADLGGQSGIGGDEDDA
jgi:hypothetical protein